MHSPQLKIKSKGMHVSHKEISTCAAKKLTPVYQTLPDMSGRRGSGIVGTFILMENLPQQPSQHAHARGIFQRRKEATDSCFVDDSRTGSPATLSFGKKETEQANVNIIVHNDFENSLSSQSSVRFNTNEATAKVWFDAFKIIIFAYSERRP